MTTDCDMRNVPARWRRHIESHFEVSTVPPVVRSNFFSHSVAFYDPWGHAQCKVAVNRSVVVGYTLCALLAFVMVVSMSGETGGEYLLRYGVPGAVLAFVIPAFSKVMAYLQIFEFEKIELHRRASFHERLGTAL